MRQEIMLFLIERINEESLCFPLQKHLNALEEIAKRHSGAPPRFTGFDFSRSDKIRIGEIEISCTFQEKGVWILRLFRKGHSDIFQREAKK